MERRNFLKTIGITASSIALPQFDFFKNGASRNPNIVFILADDLGYGELGCYGQEKIKTPNIDKLAAQGTRFTQHYSGSPVCAPSRCALLTGKHTGHCYIRDNDEMPERGDVWRDPRLEGQRPLLADTVTIAKILKEAGYKTAAIGKWGLGGPGSSGEPNKQGFDYWYGYLCQRVAHNYYPTHLWRNNKKEILEGNEYFFAHQKLPDEKDAYDQGSCQKYKGKQYSMDLFVKEAINFIQTNKKGPFFLYLAFTVPHAAIQVPDDSLKEYMELFPETPYKGEKGYLPHPAPRAAYAAMITRMDREVGRVMSLIEELGIGNDTLVIFSSDNGPTFNGGVDTEFFKSAEPFRGLKATLYEGGIRVPMIARWPGKIESGRVSNHISAFWDFLPTFTELLGIKTPQDIDGISMLPVFLGRVEKQKKHEYLYWEYNGSQAVRLADWKALRNSDDKKIELFDLRRDISEKYNISAENPKIVSLVLQIMEKGRVESELFPLNKNKK